METKNKYCNGNILFFCLHYKQLEKGKFKWTSTENQVKNIIERELRWLLDGLSIDQLKAHKEVEERSKSN